MSEALVPAVTRPPAARTGTVAMALPAVIVDAGPVAVERVLEFFAASIANGRTRAAYGRAVGRRFLSWCAARGLGLRAIAPLHVAAYIRTHPGSAPTVKQHLAAIRVLCDWLVVHQVLPVNPAAAVRGPKHVVTKGATLVLTPAETRSLLDGIDPGSLVRSSRPGAAERDGVQLRAGERGSGDAAAGLFPAGDSGVAAAAHEKGGKRHDVPAHHRAEAAVDAYLVAGGIDRGGKTDQFVAEGNAAADRGSQQRDVWIRREHADDSVKAHQLVDESQQSELSGLGGAGVVVSVDRHRHKHGRPVSLEKSRTISW